MHAGWVLETGRRAIASTAFDPLEEIPVARVSRCSRHRLVGQLASLVEIAEAGEAVGERRRDLVLEGLHAVCVAEVMLGVPRPLERHVEKVTEVVVVPGVLGRDHQRAPIRSHRRSEVPEERLTEAHESVDDIVVLTGASDLAQVKRGLPRVRLDPQLGEVPMREECVLTSVADDGEKLRQKCLDVGPVRTFGERVFGEPSEPIGIVGSTAHA